MRSRSYAPKTHNSDFCDTVYNVMNNLLLNCVAGLLYHFRKNMSRNYSKQVIFVKHR